MHNSDKKINTPYYLLGGEQAIRNLCDTFYSVMDSSPETQTIRAMHGKDLSKISQRLFEYLSSWLGGPDLYVEKYGSMCISQAHAPYVIGEAERDQWLLCMDETLIKINAPDDVKSMLKQPFYQVANMLTAK
ncbi:MAG: group II truncated hemoglobin [Pseudomonadales bacterium]|nr:group II truncated hemoglobin [Pseudomonadales bacterium]